MVFSLSQSPDLGPQEVAARLLITPTALEGLSLDDAACIVSYMQPKRIASGTVFMREGDSSDNDYLLLVLDGEVSVNNSVNGDESGIVVTVLGPGSLIGEMGLLDDAPRSATCMADGDVMAAILTRSALVRLLREQPRVAAGLLMAMTKRMADHLRQTTRKVKALAQLNLTLRQELNLVLNHRTPTPPRS